MAGYSFDMLRGTLKVSDTPLSYHPPVGPGIAFTSTYNQADLGQLTNTPFAGLGTNWTYNWLSYIVGNPDTGAIPITRYAPGGGLEYYHNFQVAPSDQFGIYNPTTQRFSFNQSSSPEQFTQAVLHWNAGVGAYTRTLPDGSTELYSQLVTYQGVNYYLITQQTDAQGNTISFGYDAYNRLVSVTDATGQATTLYYATNSSLKIDHITDPFSRTVQFSYDSHGRLQSATDPQGIVSTYGYDSTGFLNSLTTPYGTTTFSTDSDVNHQGIQATNPLGQTERAELRFNSPTGVADTDTVPTGINAAGSGLSQFNTYYWDRRQYTSPLNYANCVITHWMTGAHGLTNLIDSQKKPLEGRVWYNYTGQTTSDLVNDSALNRATLISRILDDGTVQSTQASYSPTGMLTQSIDPLGRTTNYNYDATGIDLLTVKQTNGSGQDLLSTMTYTSATQPIDLHVPVTIVDAAGQTTTMMYNSQGQPTSRAVTVGGSNQTTTMAYYGRNGTGTGNYLTLVTAPMTGATTSYTYDSVGRVATVTDSEGYTITSSYDNLDRLTSTQYPDGTTDQTLYNNPATPLDVAQSIDRQGRTTNNQYDAIRELIKTTDPLNRTLQYGWCTCGGLATLTDANNNTTTWNHDLQGRVTSKVYPDSSQIIYTYETTTSRLHKMVDAVGNSSTYTYNKDNTLASTAYSPASGVAATPNVSFTYDPVYNRVLTMVDGTGTNQYSYNPVNGALGAGRLASVTTPIMGTGQSAVISYTNSAGAVGYDELGRVVGRSIDLMSTNATSVATTYDSLGRVTNVSNALGSFTYGYINSPGPSSRLASVTYPSGTGMSMSYGYYGNTAASGTGNGDQRLQTITNTQGTNQISQFGYTYKPVGTIATWTQQTNSGTAAITNTYTYDNADQLTSAAQSGGGSASNAYHYDPAGNRLAEITGSGTSVGQFNNLNQLTGYSSSSTNQVVAGHTSAAVTNVTINAIPATISNATNFSATVPLPNGTNVVSVVAIPSNSTNSAPVTQRYAVTVSGASTPATLTYDANGNVLTDESGNTYTWDALNRLVGIAYHSGTNSGNHTEFAYDGLSRRVQILEKTGTTYGSGTILTGGTKNDLWIGQEIAEERDSTNKVTKTFFPQGEQQAGANYYYSRDHLGSIREVCSSTGTIVARYSYDPYGKTTLVSGSNLATKQYAGYYAHQASGLYLTRFRAFDPNTGRWLSRDPIVERGGLNLYGYVNDDPAGMIDPLGLLRVSPSQAAKTLLVEDVVDPGPQDLLTDPLTILVIVIIDIIPGDTPQTSPASPTPPMPAPSPQTQPAQPNTPPQASIICPNPQNPFPLGSILKDFVDCIRQSSQRGYAVGSPAERDFLNNCMRGKGYKYFNLDDIELYPGLGDLIRRLRSGK